jgi:membrane protein insertase Oxa1/YidC/SpoIIIJ
MILFRFCHCSVLVIFPGHWAFFISYPCAVVSAWCSSALVTAVHHHCLRKALEHEQHKPGSDGGGGTDYVERLLLSLVVHCSKDQEHARAIEAIRKAFTCE